MKKKILSVLVLFFSLASHAASGLWKTYLSYYEPTEIEKGNEGKIYVLASQGLYSYNQNDHSLQTYDKLNALSDCNIAHIAWCKAAGKLVIVYNNNNIDLLSANGNVQNIADYMNASITENKTVNSIDVSGKYAYLSTGFGIVKLNVQNAEISNTYKLGFNVNYTHVEGKYIYAESSAQGAYRGLLTANLIDRNNWTRTGNFTVRNKVMDPALLALVKTLNPGGPKYNYFGFTKFYNGKLYSAGAGYMFPDELYRPGCVQVYDGSTWTIYQDDIMTLTGHEYMDVGSLDIDPKNESHVFASGRTGMYEFMNGRFVKEYNCHNSPLQSASTVRPNNKDYCIVVGIKYDKTGNLWVTNSISSSTSILELTSEGLWNNYHHAELVNNNCSLERMTTPVFDSRGLMWIPNNFYRYPMAVCYTPATNTVKLFNQFINEEGEQTSIMYVRAIAEDHENNMWICTDKGPFVLKPDQITASNPVFHQVKVPRNDGTNYADYLLAGVDISCMYIDKANRKWFGTPGSGIYLISSDNIHQLQHFTTGNSKLLSDNIESLSMNETTGELFIGTDNGLCSYMSDTPKAGQGMSKDNVYAYPNPVRPDYTGVITITGLDENADVKITTSNGVLVNSGKAANGQYKWYGLDRNGKRVASGVYMVEVATEEGDKGVVCKIAIIN